MQTLGIPHDNALVSGTPCAACPILLEEFVKLRKQIDPNMVFLPSSSDLHQEHQVPNAEGLRCFKVRLSGI